MGNDNKKLSSAEIEQLEREINSCGECRLEIGGPSKYKTLSTEEIIAIVEGLRLLRSIMEPGQIQHFGTLKTTRSVMILEREWDKEAKRNKDVDKTPGEFHGFGTNFMEFETGPGNFTVAIVELPDGTVMAVDCTMIRFLDVSA